MNSNGRKFKMVLVPDEGYVRTYTFYGELTPLYILKTKHALLYAGYRLISKELDLAFGALKELTNVNHKSDLIVQSLSFTAIIAYGKCFADAKGRKVKLEDSALKYVKDDLLLEHKRFLDIRNNYIAHGGKGEYERNPVCVALHPTDRQSIITVYDNLYYTSSITSSVPAFLSLIGAVNKYVEDKINIHKEKMNEELLGLKLSEIQDKIFDPRDAEVYVISATGIPGADL